MEARGTDIISLDATAVEKKLSDLLNQLSFRQGLRQCKGSQYLMGGLTGAVTKTWLPPASVPMNIMDWKTIKEGQG